MTFTFRTGDRVRFLHDTGTGIVTGFSADGKISVLVDDFLEESFPADQLVPDQSAAEQAAKELQQKKTSEPPVSLFPDTVDGVWLGYTQVSGKESCKLFLWNNTPYRLFLNLMVQPGMSSGMSYHEPGIEPGEQMYLLDFVPPVQGSGAEWRFQLLYLAKPGQSVLSPLDVSLKFKPGFYKKSASPDTPVLFRCLNHTEGQMAAEAEPLVKHKFARVPEEVDLHAEKLEGIQPGMKDHEILEVQMNEFVRWMDLAIMSGAKSITFIHGVGKGSLKSRILKYVSAHQDVDFFEDAQKEKFGYGATKISFR